jgi:hypothetical protein
MALTESDPVALEAVDIFLSIVGAEAGAMALRCLARGGVYVAGGIVPRLMERVGALREAFYMRKGRERFTGILQVGLLFCVGGEDKGNEVAARLSPRCGIKEIRDCPPIPHMHIQTATNQPADRPTDQPTYTYHPPTQPPHPHPTQHQTIPLYVVTNTKVGIIGSREVALRLVEKTN